MPDSSKQFSPFHKAISCFLMVTFTCSVIFPPQLLAQTMPVMPPAGAMVPPSPAGTLPVLKGIQIYPENPLQFGFIMDRGTIDLNTEARKSETLKMAKYFLASLAIPEEDMWVNLSPYEKDRMIDDDVGQTELGRDMLAQDYLLKQLTASLIYPEDGLGKAFWDKVYKKVHEKYGTTNIPVNTFNKVWIVSDQAEVYEGENSAFVLNSHLKVMLEEDYLALETHQSKDGGPVTQEGDVAVQAKRADASTLASEIVREIIVPAIEQEVNEGTNFAPVRQIYNAHILAVWYKHALKEALLNKIYSDQNKIQGVDLEDKTQKEKIYRQYVESFEKGAFNVIKEDYDESAKDYVARRYFSGGLGLPRYTDIQVKDAGQIMKSPGDLADLKALEATPVDFADIAVVELSSEELDRASVTLQSDPATLKTFNEDDLLSLTPDPQLQVALRMYYEMNRGDITNIQVNENSVIVQKGQGQETLNVSRDDFPAFVVAEYKRTASLGQSGYKFLSKRWDWVIEEGGQSYSLEVKVDPGDARLLNDNGDTSLLLFGPSGIKNISIGKMAIKYAGELNTTGVGRRTTVYLVDKTFSKTMVRDGFPLIVDMPMPDQGVETGISAPVTRIILLPDLADLKALEATPVDFADIAVVELSRPEAAQVSVPALQEDGASLTFESANGYGVITDKQLWNTESVINQQIDLRLMPAGTIYVWSDNKFLDRVKRDQDTEYGCAAHRSWGIQGQDLLTAMREIKAKGAKFFILTQGQLNSLSDLDFQGDNFRVVVLKSDSRGPTPDEISGLKAQKLIQNETIVLLGIAGQNETIVYRHQMGEETAGAGLIKMKPDEADVSKIDHFDFNKLSPDPQLNAALKVYYEMNRGDVMGIKVVDSMVVLDREISPFTEYHIAEELATRAYQQLQKVLELKEGEFTAFNSQWSWSESEASHTSQSSGPTYALNLSADAKTTKISFRKGQHREEIEVGGYHMRTAGVLNATGDAPATQIYLVQSSILDQMVEKKIPLIIELGQSGGVGEQATQTQGKPVTQIIFLPDLAEVEDFDLNALLHTPFEYYEYTRDFYRQFISLPKILREPRDFTGKFLLRDYISEVLETYNYPLLVNFNVFSGTDFYQNNVSWDSVFNYPDFKIYVSFSPKWSPHWLASMVGSTSRKLANWLNEKFFFGVDEASLGEDATSGPSPMSTPRTIDVNTVITASLSASGQSEYFPELNPLAIGAQLLGFVLENKGQEPPVLDFRSVPDSHMAQSVLYGLLLVGRVEGKPFSAKIEFEDSQTQGLLQTLKDWGQEVKITESENNSVQFKFSAESAKNIESTPRAQVQQHPAPLVINPTDFEDVHSLIQKVTKYIFNFHELSLQESPEIDLTAIADINKIEKLLLGLSVQLKPDRALSNIESFHVNFKCGIQNATGAGQYWDTLRVEGMGLFSFTWASQSMQDIGRDMVTLYASAVPNSLGILGDLLGDEASVQNAGSSQRKTTASAADNSFTKKNPGVASILDTASLTQVTDLLRDVHSTWANFNNPVTITVKGTGRASNLNVSVEGKEYTFIGYLMENISQTKNVGKELAEALDLLLWLYVYHYEIESIEFNAKFSFVTVRIKNYQKKEIFFQRFIESLNAEAESLQGLPRTLTNLRNYLNEFTDSVTMKIQRNFINCEYFEQSGTEISTKPLTDFTDEIYDRTNENWWGLRLLEILLFRYLKVNNISQIVFDTKISKVLITPEQKSAEEVALSDFGNTNLNFLNQDFASLAANDTAAVRTTAADRFERRQGGIDLKNVQDKLIIKRGPDWKPLPVDQQDLGAIQEQLKSLTPILIQQYPMPNIVPLLGFDPGDIQSASRLSSIK